MSSDKGPSSSTLTQFLRFAVKLVGRTAATIVLLMMTQAMAASDQPNVGTAAPDAPVSGSAFLSTLKNISDAGSLVRPEETASVLGIQLQEATKRQDVQLPFCEAPATSDLYETTTLDVKSAWWYRAQSNAPGNLVIPAAFINRASTSGDPSFHYEIVHTIKCTDRFGLRDTRKATMSFGGLPSFACLTPRQIIGAIPGAIERMATDGVSLVDYAGHLDDDTGTSLQFAFRMGVQCALSATIEQSQELGLRALRARNISSICRAPARRAWCAEHGPIGWENGAALDQMELYADRKCGTEDSIYRKEPASGSRPVPVPVPPVKLGGLPCDQ